MARAYKSVCVYCASSQRVDPAYFAAARTLGAALAGGRRRIVYGGGSVGLMGALADAALEAGGQVTGVIPAFMHELEWGHPGISELHVVDDMHVRKRRMIAESEAFVALPGGCGTFEELFEAITWKRLGLHRGPIVIVNVREYFDPCVRLLEHSVREGFMNHRHSGMWRVVERAEDVLPTIDATPPWPEGALGFAAP